MVRAIISVAIMFSLVSLGLVSTPAAARDRGRERQPKAEMTSSAAAPETPVPETPTPETAVPETPEAHAVQSDTDPVADGMGAFEVFSDTRKIRVAVMELATSDIIDANLAQSLVAVIPKALESLGLFEVASAQDVMRLIQYQATRQALGDCAASDCVGEIGSALGAEYMISGNLTRTGDDYVLQLSLTNNDAAEVQNRVQRDYSGSQSGLFGEVRAATKILVRELLEAHSGYLAIEVSEEGATIKVDDQVLGVSPTGPIKVAGGLHTLAIEKQGFVLHRADVQVAEEQVSAHTARLIPSADYLEDYSRRAELWRAMSWVGIGVGAAAVVTAGVLWGVATTEAQSLNADIAIFNEQIDRTSPAFDSLRTREQQVAMMDGAGMILLATGAAAITTGVIIRYLGDDPDRYEAETSVSAVSLAIGPMALGVVGRF